ncbi:MAG TPA: tryptophan synthase subunit alpha [Methylophilaceae bacterium]|nr:tryptophan synthase subunit alpha [Methylophilaceae bacterium]
MSRIKTVFDQLKNQQRKALIPFITAGDPNPQQTVPMMHALVQGGADMIELGVPFSDPMADGPTIQRASERALVHNIGLRDVLNMVAEFRQQNANTPVVLMGYGNPIEAMGWAQFAQRCAAVGVDGVLTVDFPPEESGEAFKHLAQYNIDPIFLLAPTSAPERVEAVVAAARGFIYYVSLRGVTGAANLDLADVAEKVAAIRGKTSLPVGVGFGVRDAATAKAVAEIADAVVVGSRMVQEVENSNEQNVAANLAKLTQELRAAIDSN